MCLTIQDFALGMGPFNDDHIARLLRLKRYEQPPPGYFENFVQEFRRRRQRDELFREPLRSVCVDRMRDFIFWHNVRAIAGYSAGAATAAACIAVIAIIAFQQPSTTQLMVQSSPVPARPSMVDEQLEFEPASINMQPALQPAGTDLLLLPGSDEIVPLTLEWDSLDDQSPLDAK